MNYEVDLPTPNHDAEWLENIESDGVMRIVCNEVPTEPGADMGSEYLVYAGWGHFNLCPVCGTDIDLSTEMIP